MADKAEQKKPTKAGLATPPDAPMPDDAGDAGDSGCQMDAGGPQAMPPKNLVNKKMLAPSAAVQRILFARLETLDAQDVKALDKAITPETAPVLAKIFPELMPLIQNGTQVKGKNIQAQPNDYNGPMANPKDFNAVTQAANQQDQSQGAGGGSQSGTQMAPIDPNSMFGFSKGGVVMHGHSTKENGGMPVKTGFANKGIPTSGFARGGHVVAAPHPNISLNDSFGPALRRQASRQYNRPMADGGLIPNGNYAEGGVPVDPNADQGMPHLAAGGPPQGLAAPRDIANMAVPKEGTSDQVDAKLSKGEYVMDAATVQYFGAKKLMDMQKKAQEGMAQHIMQQEQDQHAGGPSQPQAPQTQPPQQAQPPQAGLASPPPQMQAATANAAGTQPQPDATQQRIQATDNSKPQMNPMSLAG